MSDEAARTAGEIEALLGTRQRISEWLHRLGQSGTNVPAAVRDRVRSDYQGRLGKVVDELRGHSATISENLAGLRRELADRERVRAGEEEALAEAQLRYAVGEYAEEEWQAHEERSGTRLEVLGGEIHRISAEIVRMEDVLAQIAGAPAPAAAAAAVAAATGPVETPDEAAPAEFEVINEEAAGAGAFGIGSETFITLEDGPSNPATQSVFDAPPMLPTDPDPAMELPTEPVMPEAPRFTPKSGAIPPRPRPSGSHKPAEDEMAFLKSVTVEPHKPGRANGSDFKSAAAAAAVATKTLKCQDCGTLNRPTEWYCERCGAELSAV